MKSLSCPPSAAVDYLRLDAAPLSLEEAFRALGRRDAGGLSFFVGTVREEEDGRFIDGIRYGAYEPMARRLMAKIKTDAERRRPVTALIHHRLGWVPVGGISLLAACAGVHREEAFTACREIVEEVKTTLPVWKEEFKWK